MEGYSKVDSVDQVETVYLITQGHAELPVDTLVWGQWGLDQPGLSAFSLVGGVEAPKPL